jgi:hypothetical protein
MMSEFSLLLGLGVGIRGDSAMPVRHETTNSAGPQAHLTINYRIQASVLCRSYAALPADYASAS